MDELRALAIAPLCCVIFTSPASASAAAPSTTQSTTAPADSLQLWTSPPQRVRLRYPVQWQILAPPPAGQVFAARIPLHDPAVPFAAINLKIDRATLAPAGANQANADKSAMMDISDALASYVFNNGGKKVTIRPDTLGSDHSPSGAIPARRVRFITDRPSGPVATMEVVAVKNGIAYVWTIAAPATAMDALLPPVERTLATFETLQ